MTKQKRFSGNIEEFKSLGYEATEKEIMELYQKDLYTQGFNRGKQTGFKEGYKCKNGTKLFERLFIGMIIGFAIATFLFISMNT